MTQDSHALSPAEVSAFYQVAGARRDIRNGFLSDPVDDGALTRVLAAAHQAPSVAASRTELVRAAYYRRSRPVR